MIMKLRRSCILFVRRFSVFLFIFTFVLLFSVLSRTYSSNPKLNDVSRRILEIFYNETFAVEENIIDKKMISRLIKAQNKEQEIRNVDNFGPIVEDTTILVILVDENVDDAKRTLLSLSRMNGIEELLIIFSHSYYDEPINRMIQSIDFCRVMQIHYPFSVQLHPDEFPGLSHNDCPYNLNPKKAVRSNCTGAHTPDIIGLYRVPYKTQKKNHWWWTANTVFEKLSFSSEHTGLVIFLDDYVIFMKDFIYIATYMKNIAESVSCEFLSFGGNSLHQGNFNETDFYRIELSFWQPSKYWNILAFDVSVWNSIVPHYDLFCSFDDSSWTRSLYYISINRKDGKRYKTLSSMGPRVFRARSCVFYGIFKCDLSQNLAMIDEIENLNDENLFPPFLELHIKLLHDENEISYDMIGGMGGFADPRDKALCHNLTVSKIKKVVLEMKYEYRDSSQDE